MRHRHLLGFFSLLLCVAAALPATGNTQTLTEYVIRDQSWTGGDFPPTSQGPNSSASSISYTGPDVAFDTVFWGSNDTSDPANPSGHRGQPSPDNLFLIGWPDALELSRNYYQFSVSADAGFRLYLNGIQVGIATEQASDDALYAGPTTYRLYASTSGTFNDAGDYLDQIVVTNSDAAGGDLLSRGVLSASLEAEFGNVESVVFRVYAFADAGEIGAGGIANIRDNGFSHVTADDFTNVQGVYTSPTSDVIISGVSATEPDQPGNVQATAGDAQASVSFDAPASDGGAAISSYTVTSTPGGITQSGSSSPIVVTGLDNGTPYTFDVTATNVAGPGPASAASNAVTPMGEQTITFNNPGAQNFGTSPTLSATASSGLIVSFSSTTSGVCTITEGGALTLVAPGSCTISANQAGDTEFNPAPQVQQTFQINAVAPGAPQIGTATLGNTEATVSFTPPSFTGGAAVTGYTVTSSPGGLTGTGAASPITVTGLTNGVAYTFTVTATSAAGTSLASAASNAVTPTASQTITFDNPGSLSFGSSPQLVASINSPLDIEFSTETPAICTVTGGGVLTFVSTGECTINADQPGGGGFEPAPRVSRSFMVEAVAPGIPTNVVATAQDEQATVSFDAPGFNGGAEITEYTVTSSPGDIEQSGTDSPITISGLTNGMAYTFTVTATNAVGTSGESIASAPVIPISDQSITFDQPDDQNFGTAPQLVATASSGSAVVFSSVTPAVCTVTAGGLLTLVAAGDCEINADEPGDAAWRPAATVTRTFEVLAVAPGAPVIGTATAGDSEATITFTAPGFDGSSTITGYTVTSSPGDISVTGAGSPLTVPGLTNGVSYTFLVTATNDIGTGVASDASNAITPSADQIITFNDPGTQNYNETPTLIASSDSGLSVEFNVDPASAAVCSITTEGTLSFLAVGNCTVHANQSGNDAFNAATEVTRTFAVERVNLAPELTIAGSLNYVAGSAAAQMDASAAVSDQDLDALNGGEGDYTGASLTIERDGGANSDDLFSVADGGTLSVTGGPDGGGTVSVAGDTIAEIDDTGDGQLQLTFQNNGTIVTRDLAIETLRAVQYAKVAGSPTGSVDVIWTFNDGNSGDQQGTGGDLEDTQVQSVNVQPPQSQTPADVVSTQTTVNHTSGTLTITSQGVVTGGTLGGTVNNSGTITGDITLLANVTINGGTISGKLTGDPQQPAVITGGTITSDAVLSNVLIGDDTVLDPGVELGPNVKFVSNSTIPPAINLTESLNAVQWATGDGRQLVDLWDEVLVGENGEAPVPLIEFVQVMQGLAEADVDLTQSGEIEVISNDFSSLVLPVSVSQAEPEVAEGIYFNDDGDIILVTENRRVVVAYPVLADQPAFLDALQAQGLQLSYDARANLIVSSASGQQNPDEGMNIMSLQTDSYYSGRPDVLAVPAHRGAQPGMIGYPVAGLGSVGGISLIFEDQQGRLMEQDIVPVPVDQAALRDAILAIEGVSSVRIGTDGVIVAIVDGTTIRGRMDYTVYREQASPRESVLLRLVGDVSGNGYDDYEITYTNGDQQMLFIYPVE